MRRNATVFILIILITSVFLSGCGAEETVTKSRFGQLDAMQDGQILIRGDDPGDEGDPDTEESSDTDVTDDKPMKTAKSLDPNGLPDNIKMMADLCDAINMTCVELRMPYGQADNEFMWHSVHEYVDYCTDREMGFKKVGDTIEADPDVIGDVMYAMFGKLREIPQVPEGAFVENDEGDIHIRLSNDLKYRFSKGDRGSSEPEIRSATEYSDSSLEMEVALVDSETGEETVNFIYTMRANTRDTSASALIDYEITGARPADRITSDKMNGTPYIVPMIQSYGYDSYPADDPRSAQVEEVLQFASFNAHVPGMEELNNSILKNIIESAAKPESDDRWRQIISYPLTTDDYVQIAITAAEFPTNGSDPDIHCYNYDKKKQRALDINDAQTLCGKSNADIQKRVEGLWKPQSDGETLEDINYRGFIVRRDASVDMFYMISVRGGESKEHDSLIVYNSGSDDLRYAFGNVYVYPDDELDQMKPKLTHGRKAGGTDA